MKTLDEELQEIDTKEKVTSKKVYYCSPQWHLNKGHEIKRHGKFEPCKNGHRTAQSWCFDCHQNLTFYYECNNCSFPINTY